MYGAGLGAGSSSPAARNGDLMNILTPLAQFTGGPNTGGQGADYRSESSNRLDSNGPTFSSQFNGGSNASGGSVGTGTGSTVSGGNVGFIDGSGSGVASPPSRATDGSSPNSAAISSQRATPSLADLLPAGYQFGPNSASDPVFQQAYAKWMATVAATAPPNGAPQSSSSFASWLNYEYNTAMAMVQNPLSTIGGYYVGLGQGVLNGANGFQNAVIAIPNLVPTIWNSTAGQAGAPAMGYIPSPDWSENVLVQDDPYHHVSMFLGGQGAFTLVTLGLGQVSQATQLTHFTSQEAAAAIHSQGLINGSQGVYAASTTFLSPTLNQVATLTTNATGQVAITGQAATLFQPAAVVGPISMWTRLMSGAHYAPYSQINLASGTGVPLANVFQWPIMVDYALWLSLQTASQGHSGTLTGQGTQQP